ncbi:MAG: hypothetical protein ACYC4L_19720 [Chloroflexota bacterium]
MGLLEGMLGDEKQRQGFQDFIRRYDEGHPAEGYSEQEVMDLYQQLAPDIPHDVYERAAEQSFSRLSADERLNFVRQLQQQTGSASMGYSDQRDVTNDQQYRDPAYLARMVASVHQQNSDLLCRMVGGCQDLAGMGDGLLTGLEAKAVLAGIVAGSLRQVLSADQATSDVHQQRG